MDTVVGIRLRRNGNSTVIRRIKYEESNTLRGRKGSKKQRPKSMPQLMDSEVNLKGSPWWSALSPSLRRRKAGKRNSSNLKATNSVVIEEGVILERLSSVARLVSIFIRRDYPY